MPLNMYLQEAVDKSFNPAPFVAEFKKVMNTCQLTKFKSQGECARFYSAFFMCSSETELTFEQWTLIYTSLLNDESFMKNLCMFMIMYQPQEYTGMFQSLIRLIDSEILHIRDTKIRYLSNAKAFFNFMQMKMDSVGITIKSQINDQNVMKFITTVNSVLTTDIFYINNLIQRELDNSYNKDDISYEVTQPLEEDVQDLLSTLQSYDSFMNENTVINEGIINNAKEKAKELYLKQQKAGKAFDEFVMKKVKRMRENRRNRKHAEMVGEALRINHEIKRLLGSLAIGAINPAVGVIVFLVSFFYDRTTDKRDRDVLVGQLKDELEIIEEKISQAERNGDDKGKVQLIRARQQLTKEYERINRIKYDPSRSIANRR